MYFKLFFQLFYQSIFTYIKSIYISEIFRMNFSYNIYKSIHISEIFNPLKLFSDICSIKNKKMEETIEETKDDEIIKPGLELNTTCPQYECLSPEAEGKYLDSRLSKTTD